MKYGIRITKLKADEDKVLSVIWYWNDDGQPRLFDTREEAQEYMEKNMEIFVDPSGARHTTEVGEYR